MQRRPSWVVASKSWKTSFRTSLKVLKVCQKKKWRESLERKFWMVNWEGKWTSLWKYGSDWWKIHLGVWVALPNMLVCKPFKHISWTIQTHAEKRWLDNWLTFDNLLYCICTLIYVPRKLHLLKCIEEKMHEVIEFYHF